jgi:aldose 1-epimerase
VTSADEATPTAELFGTLPDGRVVDAYRLTNSCGMSATILTYGGVVQSVEVPDSRGETRNVVLGFARLDDYLLHSPYFGAVIGRFANRIADGSFELDGVVFTLPLNEPPTSLHGGKDGFDKKLWRARPFTTDAEWIGVRLTYVSPDGEEGYPGTLNTTVTYRLARQRNTLAVDYRATTDRPTVVNLTNHSYFNLAGEGSGSVLDHEVEIRASRYLPLGPGLVPTGELADVAGTPMDFRTPKPIGERIRSGFDQLALAQGYDHNYVVDRSDGSAGELVLASRIRDPKSGRALEVWTSEPGVDFYSGNFLDGSLVGTSGSTYRQSDAFAIEPEHFSNSPNTPQFASTRLDPGETYESHSEYRFSV